jgi:hypothetical protein
MSERQQILLVNWFVLLDELAAERALHSGVRLPYQCLSSGAWYGRTYAITRIKELVTISNHVHRVDDKQPLPNRNETRTGAYWPITLIPAM